MNEGIPGAKSAAGKWFIRDWIEQHLPEFTLIMYGTNDSLDPNGCTQWGEPYGCLVQENLREVIQECRQRGVLPILATVIPPNPEEHWAENPRIYYNNDLIRELAWQENVQLVDMFDAFYYHYPGELASLYADSLHLTEAGYEYMAEIFFQAIAGLH